jgi:hypothetical protein
LLFLLLKTSELKIKKNQTINLQKWNAMFTGMFYCILLNILWLWTMQIWHLDLIGSKLSANYKQYIKNNICIYIYTHTHIQHNNAMATKTKIKSQLLSHY